MRAWADVGVRGCGGAGKVKSRRGEWPREKREERKERREYLSSFLVILFPMHTLSYASSLSLFTLSSSPLYPAIFYFFSDS